MILSPSHRAREIARIMERHAVSYSTASRWVDSGRQSDLEARHVDRQKLREECAASGVSMGCAHNRKYEGYPRDALAMPIKERSPERKPAFIKWCTENGPCSIAQAMALFRWTRSTARSRLSEWTREGDIERVSEGVYDVRRERAAS